jgi:Flp pilus assembly protein TadD
MTNRTDHAVELLHALGYHYGENGESKRALALLAVAVQLAPGHIEVLRTLAHAFVIDGDPDRALFVIDRLRKLAGGDNPMLDLLASHALWSAGRALDARRSFRDFLDRRRQYP